LANLFSITVTAAALLAAHSATAQTDDNQPTPADPSATAPKTPAPKTTPPKKPSTPGPASTPAEPPSTPELKKGKELISRTAFAKTQSAKTMQDYTEVIDLCQQGLQLGVDKPTGEYASKLMAWAHNRRGELYAAGAVGATDPKQRTQLDQKSLSEFETAIQLDASCWRAYHNRGVNLAQVRDYEGAIKDFDQTIELRPNYANAWFNRGELHYATGKYQLAVDDYNQTLKLNANDAAAHNSRGHARYRLGQYREALEDYNRSVELDPNNAAAYTNRGDAYTDQGYYDRAAVDYRRAIELNPNYGRAYQSAAWLMATCPEDRYRDDKKAVDAALKALKLDGANDYRYHDALAAAYANAGRYDDAQEVLKKALELAPEADAKPLRDRLALYQQNKPYRDTPRIAARPSSTPPRRPTR
jgi:tetratricopeptide (TPR) repeat protein